MRLGFETLGNATLVFYDEDKPVLATDPWLQGTCYYGSWALDRPLTDAELKAVLAAEYLWISHGHPDHFHVQSLGQFPKGKKFLLPDHYSPDIKNFLTHQGFDVTVMKYREWRQISPKIRAMCLENENQDAVLVIEAGDSLIVNLNDSPLYGEDKFLRGLVRKYDRSKTYMAALCSNDADMFNIVDAEGQRIVDPPDVRKRGMVWHLARIADRLGVGSYVCSASQHIYARDDAVWANPYRVGFADVVRHWTRPDIKTVEPFVVVNLETGAILRKHPSGESFESQITGGTNGDDWNDVPTEAEWEQLSAFFLKIETLRHHLDYLEFVVGGVRRKVWFNPDRKDWSPAKLRGITFHAPRQSLIRTLKYGYFDDMLIGNFMRTELHNASLYPDFTPLVAKAAGSARIFTDAALTKFNRHYFRRNPTVYCRHRLEVLRANLIDWVRSLAEKLGVKRPLKILYRRFLGDPVI